MPGELFRLDSTLGHLGSGLRDADHLRGDWRDFGDLGSPVETLFGGECAPLEDRGGGVGSFGCLFTGSDPVFMGADRMVHAAAAGLSSAALGDAVSHARGVGLDSFSTPSPARISWRCSFGTVEIVTLTEALKIRQQNSKDAPLFEVRLACGFTPLHVQTFLGAHIQQALPGRNIAVTPGVY